MNMWPFRKKTAYNKVQVAAPSVSSPYNLKHQVHVDFNSDNGYRGLPKEWEPLLKAGGVTKDDVLQNPELVLDVLEFTHNQIKKAEEDARSANEALPPEKAVTLNDLVSKEDPNKLYLNLTKIGEGAAGEVFLAVDAKTNEKVAIKKMPLNAQNVKLLTSEIHIMKESTHPNIVRYLDSFRVEDKLWVAMEYMGGGCLTEILEQFEDVQMSEGNIAWVCQETLKGLAYIHSLHRIHRDIRATISCWVLEEK